MPQLIGTVIAIYIIYVLIVAVAEFVRIYIAPAIGAIIVAVVAIGVGYAIYMYFKDPTKRIIKNISTKIEEKRQKFIVYRELARKLSSEGEQAQVKAMLLSNQLYEKTKLAIGNESINNELEKFKIKAEERILTSKIEDINSIIARYKRTIAKIEEYKHLSSGEKAKLYKNATVSLSTSSSVPKIVT